MVGHIALMEDIESNILRLPSGVQDVQKWMRQPDKLHFCSRNSFRPKKRGWFELAFEVAAKTNYLQLKTSFCNLHVLNIFFFNLFSLCL